MYNLLVKELKLGIVPFFYLMPFLTGALILIPSWLYFLVPLYFCMISVPTIFSGYRAQNDLMFSVLMPVSRNDIVKARILIIALLELLHIVVAMIYGLFHQMLFPNMRYLFFEPTISFFGLCFVMLVIFNIILLTMYYKTAYKYGIALILATTTALIFATGAEWLGLKNAFVYNIFKGTYASHTSLQIGIFVAGILIFVLVNIITYAISIKEFEKVDI